MNGLHREIKEHRMDVGDLSSSAGLAGSGSIPVATGVGVITSTTSATAGWWTPTSTIATAAANTDVVSFIFFTFSFPNLSFFDSRLLVFRM